MVFSASPLFQMIIMTFSKTKYNRGPYKSRDNTRRQAAKSSSNLYITATSAARRTNATSRNPGFLPPYINQAAYPHRALFRGLRSIIDGDSTRGC